MKKFVKNYIGKAKKVEGLEIIKINLKISDLIKFAHKYNDEDYISLEVAKLQSTDALGNTSQGTPTGSCTNQTNRKIQIFKKESSCRSSLLTSGIL